MTNESKVRLQGQNEVVHFTIAGIQHQVLDTWNRDHYHHVSNLDRLVNINRRELSVAQTAVQIEFGQQ